jgi:hypothetical protein
MIFDIATHSHIIHNPAAHPAAARRANRTCPMDAMQLPLRRASAGALTAPAPDQPALSGRVAIPRG